MRKMNDEILLATGFDDAYLGLVWRKGTEPVALYSYTKVISILMDDGMTEEEAEEYFGFNIEDAWVGDYTPAWVKLGDLDELRNSLTAD